jgi:hypothetical protein
MGIKPLMDNALLTNMVVIAVITGMHVVIIVTKETVAATVLHIKVL